MLHDIEANKLLRQSHAIFSPDGTEIVVASSRHRQLELKPELAAYSLQKPAAKPRLFPTPTAAILNLAFLDENTLAAAGGESNGTGVIRCYDYSSAAPIAAFTGHRRWVQALAANGDGAIASTSWEPRPAPPPMANSGSGNSRIAAQCRGERRRRKRIHCVRRDQPERPAPHPRRLGPHPHRLGPHRSRPPRASQATARITRPGSAASPSTMPASTHLQTEESGMVNVWNASTLARLASFKAAANAIYRAKFTPNGSAIVTVSGRLEGEGQERNSRLGCRRQESAASPIKPAKCGISAFSRAASRCSPSAPWPAAPTTPTSRYRDFAAKQVLRPDSHRFVQGCPLPGHFAGRQARRDWFECRAGEGV